MRKKEERKIREKIRLFCSYKPRCLSYPRCISLQFSFLGVVGVCTWARRSYPQGQPHIHSEVKASWGLCEIQPQNVMTQNQHMFLFLSQCLHMVWDVGLQ